MEACAEAMLGRMAEIIEKTRVFFNHPLFIESVVERTRAAIERLPPERRDGARVAFTAHSLPVAMAEQCAYQEQLEEACRLVASELNKREWQLVYQSRSGAPQTPWLGPDVMEHAEALQLIGTTDLVVVPIGFVSDHMEVVYDLDIELRGACEEMDLNMVRAKTPGAHPKLVSMFRELVEERLGRSDRRRALGTMGPGPDECPEDCCAPASARKPANSATTVGEVPAAKG